MTEIGTARENERIMDKCTQQEAEKRYQDCRELLVELECLERNSKKYTQRASRIECPSDCGLRPTRYTQRTSRNSCPYGAGGLRPTRYKKRQERKKVIFIVNAVLATILFLSGIVCDMMEGMELLTIVAFVAGGLCLVLAAIFWNGSNIHSDIDSLSARNVHKSVGQREAMLMQPDEDVTELLADENKKMHIKRKKGRKLVLLEEIMLVHIDEAIM